MNRRLTATAALIACLWVACSQSVQAQQQNEYQVANPFRSASSQRVYQTAGQSETEVLQMTEEELRPEPLADEYSTFESNKYHDGFLDSHGGGHHGGGHLGKGGGILGLGILDRPGRFFIGVDYLNVRSTFSESTAFVVQTGTAPTVGNTLLPPITNVFQELDYGYSSNYRVFGGYRLDDCGGEIRFAYTRFDTGASAVSQSAVPGTAGNQTTQILSPFDLVATSSTDRITTNSNVRANIYDLGFAKTIPLGSPACGGCDSCASGCDSSYDNSCDSGCGWCPAWDIKWSAGIRFADIGWDRRTTNSLSTGDFGNTTMNFDGGGARVGLQGTRYLGRKQRFAVFASGNMSLLLGSVDITVINGSNAGIGNTTLFSSTQIIPVLDIEAGGTFYVTDRLSVSAGYLLSSWFDLGMRDTYDVLEGTGPRSFDDANILGFDGYFARAVYSF